MPAGLPAGQLPAPSCLRLGSPSADWGDVYKLLFCMLPVRDLHELINTQLPHGASLSITKLVSRKALVAGEPFHLPSPLVRTFVACNVVAQRRCMEQVQRAMWHGGCGLHRQVARVWLQPAPATHALPAEVHGHQAVPEETATHQAGSRSPCI